MERDGKRCDWWGEVLNKRAMIKKKKVWKHTNCEVHLCEATGDSDNAVSI